MGYPVVLKISSPQIVHKSDAGGVKLNLGRRDHPDASVRRRRSIVDVDRHTALEVGRIVDGTARRPVLPWDSSF